MATRRARYRFAIERHETWIRRGLLAAIGLSFVIPKCWQHYAFLTNDYDTGIYSNIAWNLANGEGFFSDVLQRHHLGEHFSPIMLVFAPIFWLWPSAYVLMFAQALAVSVTFWIVLLISDEVLRGRSDSERRGVGLLILLLFFLYRPVLSALWSQFHPSTLGMPMLAGAILFLHRRRTGPFWLMVGLLLTTKELAILGVVGLAIYSALVLQRSRLAVLLLALAAVMALLVFGIVIPGMREEEWLHYGRLSWSAEPWLKSKYVATLLLSLGLLPLLAWRASMAAVPMLLLNLSVGYPPQFLMKSHYDDLNSVFLIVAAIHGARRALEVVELRIRPEYRRLPVRVAGTAFVLVLALSNRGMSPGEELSRSLASAHAAQLHQEIQHFEAELDPERRLIADPFLGPHLNHRRHYRTLWAHYRSLDYQPCDVVVLSPVVGSVAIHTSEFRKFFHDDPRFAPVSESDVLDVLRFEADGCAAPQGLSRQTP